MNTLNNFIQQFKKWKVLVIGDAILDTYVNGTIDKICREAPVPIFNTLEQHHRCGGASNTAINLAKLGADTYFLSVTGKDAAAREMIACLKKADVHTDYLVMDKSRTTLCKKRITASSSILLRIDEGSTQDVSGECEQELINSFIELYEQVDAVVISDYGYGIFTDKVLKAVQQNTATMAKPLVIDAKDLRRFRHLQPTAVKPNYEEALTILGIQKLPEGNRAVKLQPFAAQLHQLTGADKVAATLDCDGVLYLEKGKKPYHIACVPQDNKKTIGAGDTFISAFVLALTSNAPGKLAADIGAAAAAVVVQKEETVGCTLHELQACFNAVPKYVSHAQDLANIVADLRKKGKRIVFTNGCFDILHKGHVTLLSRARQLGDVLIVGINGDASIRKLKGPERPINTLDDRTTVLAGLHSVDYMISFEEETPAHLIKALRPDVFVKGGDYTEDTIPEAALVKKVGDSIAIIPYVVDHSTTNIINKIRVDTRTKTTVNNNRKEKYEVA